MLWLVCSAVLVGLISYLLTKRYTYWSNLGVAQYKFWEIWIKNVVEFIKQPPLTDAMQTLYKDFIEHRYVGIYQLFMPRLCLKDPELIKQVFVKDSDHFIDHTMFIPTDGDPIWEKSLFTLTGDSWKHVRGIASPSFTSSKIKVMFSLMSEYCENMQSYLEEQTTECTTREMKDFFCRIASDIFASTHFGVVYDSLRDPDNEFYRMGMRGIDFSGIWIKVRFVLIQMIPRVTRIFGLKVFDQQVCSFFKRVVKENIEAREKYGIVRPDLIHILKETLKGNETTKNGVVDSGFAVVKDSVVQQKVNAGTYELTDLEITALAMAFFGGGFDSTSTVLSFMSYELALQPEIQERLQEEIDSTLDECGGKLTFEALTNMKYLDMVLSETLRKWPGGFFLDRRCVKPYTIDPVLPGEKPVHLKEGAGITVPLFALHRDPQYHPDPERFDPERFSSENKANIKPYTYMPFGAGPRHCIGNRFALLQIKAVMSHILAKCNFCVVEKTGIPIKLARRMIQLVPQDEFWLGIKRRTQKKL